MEVEETERGESESERYAREHGGGGLGWLGGGGDED